LLFLSTTKFQFLNELCIIEEKGMSPPPSERSREKKKERKKKGKGKEINGEDKGKMKKTG